MGIGARDCVINKLVKIIKNYRIYSLKCQNKWLLLRFPNGQPSLFYIERTLLIFQNNIYFGCFGLKTRKMYWPFIASIRTNTSKLLFQIGRICCKHRPFEIRGRSHESWAQGANHRDSSIHLRPTATPNFLRNFLLAQKLGARA